MAELRELAASGRLAAEYPRAGELVNLLAGPDLMSAGRLLSRVDAEQISREHPGLPVVTVGITGHGTLAALAPALATQLARHGLVLRPVPTDFDSYVFELLEPDSTLRREKPDLVLCVLDPNVVFDEVPQTWSPDDVAEVADARIGLVERLAEKFDAAGNGTLVLNTMPLLRRYSGQLIDRRSRARLGAVWREVNARLLRLAEVNPSVVVLDLDPVVADGIQVSDDRLSVYAKAHLSENLLAAYAVEVGHLARQVTGRTKKCLVLDLDNTLWGGVLGDDGIDGIELGDTRRGEAFLTFQRVVKQIGSQGILLAVVSKNEPDLVHKALREHPCMLLTEDDFVQIIANWNPKHDNIGELADSLGLAVDSFVFVDDSTFERELVRRELPGVAVIDVAEDPASYLGSLLRDGWFDVREVTSEDRARPRRYRDETARRGFLDSFDSMQDYLRELGIRIHVAPASEADAARISQLTLRVNQFNLTGDRLQPRDVLELTRDPNVAVLAVRAGDRFGEHGLVGAVLSRWQGKELRIDNFLLSCRVFFRSIEEACLLWLLADVRDAGAACVMAGYRPSDRNGRVADFYPRHGFAQVGDDGDTVTFRHDLVSIEPPPAHIVLEDPGGGYT